MHLWETVSVKGWEKQRNGMCEKFLCLWLFSLVMERSLEEAEPLQTASSHQNEMLDDCEVLLYSSNLQNIETFTIFIQVENVINSEMAEWRRVLPERHLIHVFTIENSKVKNYNTEIDWVSDKNQSAGGLCYLKW